MTNYLLDTSALLTLRDDEDGSQQIAELLYQAQQGKSHCYACFMSLMEILYRVWKDEGEQAGRLAYEQVQSLPIQWLHETKELLERAATIKATHSLSIADAWIAASALLQEAVLVHKDTEFSSLKVQQLSLPFK